jgi:hypothetical protein
MFNNSYTISLNICFVLQNIGRCLQRIRLLNGCWVNIVLHPELRYSMGSNSNISSITFRKNMRLDPEVKDFMACTCATLVNLHSEQILFQLLSTVVWYVTRGRGISYLLLSYGDWNRQQLHSCQIELSTQGDIKFGKQYHGCTHQG